MLKPDRLVKVALWRRPLVPGVAAAAIVALIGVVVLSGGGPGSAATASPRFASDPIAVATASATPVPVTPDPTIALPTNPPFPPINVFLRPDHWNDPRRPSLQPTLDWLTLKASGRISLVDGRVITLPASWDPMVSNSTGMLISDKTVLDTSWTRWMIEVSGSGRDERGNWFTDKNYWEFCGDGAMTVALYYWQQLTGHPDVTGTAGYFLDPYAAEGVPWPKNGPEVADKGGVRVGTYWSGSDTVNRYTAHGRGFEFYLAMAAQPPTWQSTGYALFAMDGKPLYPAFGTPPANVEAGLNWEASGHDPSTWTHFFYTFIVPTDPTLTRDFNAAVMLDVGRERVPVVTLVDTYDLPNWQDGTATRHITHALAIVGYDNTSNPPTYTYTETCGRTCGGGTEGEIHTIPQAQLVKAMQDKSGLGFAW
jgi:hypothetical protein